MKTANQPQPTRSKRIVRSICDIIVEIVALILKVQLQFDRKVMKRYLGIETPLYTLWHSTRSQHIQRQLDMAHADWA